MFLPSISGFTFEINIDKKHWDVGFLKQYDGASLMHCFIDPRALLHFSFSANLLDQLLGDIRTDSLPKTLILQEDIGSD